MSVPEGMLPHLVAVVEPAEATDDYGNTTFDYDAGTRTEGVRAWLQQDQRDERFSTGRAADTETWLLVTNHSPIGRKARIEWTNHPAGVITFAVDGPTEPAYAAIEGSAVHHTEAILRHVEG